MGSRYTFLDTNKSRGHGGGSVWRWKWPVGMCRVCTRRPSPPPEEGSGGPGGELLGGESVVDNSQYSLGRNR